MTWINVAAPVLRHRCPMREDHRQAAPLCPCCRKPMGFVRSVPKIGALPELRTYQCQPCRETMTEADEPPLPRPQPSGVARYPLTSLLPEEGCC